MENHLKLMLNALDIIILFEDIIPIKTKEDIDLDNDIYIDVEDTDYLYDEMNYEITKEDIKDMKETSIAYTSEIPFKRLPIPFKREQHYNNDYLYYDDENNNYIENYDNGIMSISNYDEYCNAVNMFIFYSEKFCGDEWFDNLIIESINEYSYKKQLNNEYKLTSKEYHKIKSDIQDKIKMAKCFDCENGRIFKNIR